MGIDSLLEPASSGHLKNCSRFGTHLLRLPLGVSRKKHMKSDLFISGLNYMCKKIQCESDLCQCICDVRGQIRYSHYNNNNVMILSFGEVNPHAKDSLCSATWTKRWKNNGKPGLKRQVIIFICPRVTRVTCEGEEMVQAKHSFCMETITFTWVFMGGQSFQHLGKLRMEAVTVTGLFTLVT